MSGEQSNRDTRGERRERRERSRRSRQKQHGGSLRRVYRDAVLRRVSEASARRAGRGGKPRGVEPG